MKFVNATWQLAISVWRQRWVYLCLSAGFASMAVGESWKPTDKRLEWMPHELSALGGGLATATLVAWLVDRRVQAKFRTELGRNVFFALFGYAAPAEFRKAIMSYVSSVRRINDDTRITASLDWHPSNSSEAHSGRKILLTTSIIQCGRNISRQSEALSRFWLMPSTNGCKSRFTHLSLEVTDRDHQLKSPIRLGQRELDAELVMRVSLRPMLISRVSNRYLIARTLWNRMSHIGCTKRRRLFFWTTTATRIQQHLHT